MAGYIRNSSHYAAIFAHRQTTGIIIVRDRFHTAHRTGGEKSQHPRPVIRRLPVQGIHRISLLIRFQHKRYSDVTLCFHIPVVATATFR
ncbi:Uncharacterised protein [Shigella sonnei]|nr:Uncharacterised protein [Shigella sonnei]CSS42772.1 Uncharacterised protein [Shigella sonnei]